MTEQNSLLSQLNKQLGQQKVRLQQMITILDDELAAIGKRDSDKILELAKQKELQLEAIRNADAALNNDNFIEQIKKTPELTQMKEEITSLLEQCQYKNEVSYLTATQNQVAIEQVKNLLIGGSKNTTYNEYGQKNSAGSLSRGIKA